MNRAFITAKSSIDDADLFECVVINFGLRNVPRNQWRCWVNSAGLGIKINDELKIVKYKARDIELTDLFIDSDIEYIKSVSEKMDIPDLKYEFWFGPDEIIRLTQDNKLVDIFTLDMREIRQLLNLLM